MNNKVLYNSLLSLNNDNIDSVDRTKYVIIICLKNKNKIKIKTINKGKGVFVYFVELMDDRGFVNNSNSFDDDSGVIKYVNKFIR